MTKKVQFWHLRNLENFLFSKPKEPIFISVKTHVDAEKPQIESVDVRNENGFRLDHIADGEETLLASIMNSKSTPELQFYLLRLELDSDVTFAGQVSIVQGSIVVEHGKLMEFVVTISPKEGPYRGGKFKFTFNLKNFPAFPPVVTCNTPIYHPGIRNEDGAVSLGVLSGKRRIDYTLEDVVTGLLLLLCKPAFENPISAQYQCKRGHVCISEKFEETVQRTLRGGRYFGMNFPRNLGLNPESEPFVPKSAWSKHTDVADAPAGFSSTVNNKENFGPTTYASIGSGRKKVSCSQRGYGAGKSALTSNQRLKSAPEADTKSFNGQQRKDSKALADVQCNQALEDSNLQDSKGEDEKPEPDDFRQEGEKQDVERKNTSVASNHCLDPEGGALISRRAKRPETPMLDAEVNAAVEGIIKTALAAYESTTKRGSKTVSCWEHSAGESELMVNERSEPPLEADPQDCHDQNQEVDQSENEAQRLALEQCDQERQENSNPQDTDIQEEPAAFDSLEEKKEQGAERQSEAASNVQGPVPLPVKNGRRKKRKRNKRHLAKGQVMESGKARGQGTKVKDIDGKENIAKGKNAKGKAGESELTVNEHSKPPSPAESEDCNDKNQEVDQSENEAEGLVFDHEQYHQEWHDKCNGNVHDKDIQEKPAQDGNREEDERQDEGRQNELTPNVQGPAPPSAKNGRRKKGKRNKRHSANEQGMEGRKAGGRGAKVKDTDGKENIAKGKNAKGQCANGQATQHRGTKEENHQTLAEILNDPDMNKQPMTEHDEKDGNPKESEVESVGGEEDSVRYWEEDFLVYAFCHIL